MQLLVMAFAEILLALKQLGFYDFLLPWLFTFAVVYGLLRAANIFKDINQKISAALALVIAFFVTGYSGQMLSSFFINIFGGASMIIAGILVVVLFVTMAGFDMTHIKKTATLIILLIVGVVLWLLSAGVGKGFGILPLFSPDLIAMILVLVIIVMAVWAIVGGKEETGGAAQKGQKG